MSVRREEKGAGFVFLTPSLPRGREDSRSRPHSKWSQTTASPKMAVSPPISSRSQAAIGPPKRRARPKITVPRPAQGVVPPNDVTREPPA